MSENIDDLLTGSKYYIIDKKSSKVMFILKEEEGHCTGFYGYYSIMGNNKTFITSKIELDKKYIDAMIVEETYDLTKKKEDVMKYLEKNLYQENIFGIHIHHRKS